MGRAGGRSVRRAPHPRRSSRATRRTRARSRLIEAHRRATPSSTFGSVVSIEAFVPANQEEKLPIVREIRALATRENLSFLPPDRRMAVEAVLPPRTSSRSAWRICRTSSVASSPSWTGASARRCSSTLGEDRRVERPRRDPLHGGLRARPARRRARGELAARVLRRPPRDPGERPERATLLSLGASSCWCSSRSGSGASVRSLADAGWVLASLAVGVLWFAGIAGALELRLNMLNFIALPITFGSASTTPRTCSSGDVSTTRARSRTSCGRPAARWRSARSPPCSATRRCSSRGTRRSSRSACCR